MSPIPQDAMGAKPTLASGSIDRELPSTVEVDVVVVGAGASGLAAANSAAARGCDVVVLDASQEPGGTTAKSAGGFLVTNNDFLARAGVVEDRDATLRLMAKTSFPDRYEPTAERLGLDERDYELITTFYDRSNEVVRALEADRVLTLTLNPAVSGDPRGLPSYYTQLEEETIMFGRTLGPLAPDGQPGYGRELVRQLLAGAERKGARVVCGQRVVDILRDSEGGVAGVAADSVAGRRSFFARRAVIFATGGFAQNRELVERHMPGLVLGSCAVSASQGDLISLTEDMGVELAHMDCAWWGELPAELAIENPEVTALLFYPYGDSMIYVNREGRRVVNEKAVYDQRGPVHFVRDAGGQEPNRLLFMIYDHAVAREPTDTFPARYPVPPAGDSAPYVIEAPTLEELEARIRERLARMADHTGGVTLTESFGVGLRETIATFNRYAVRGKDPEFHRGEEPIQVDAGGPGRAGSNPNRTMYPIASEGPYYCIITGAGLLDTKGGPRINTRSQILREDGSPIPRLYGAGNCVASPAAAAYWSGGNTIGLGMTYGYIAGENAATQTRRVSILELAEAV
jgi:3-oxosteroid 1-dehydrogenase